MPTPETVGNDGETQCTKSNLLVQGLTGLHIAMGQYDKSRNTDVVKILLEAGADINKKADDKAADKYVK